MTQELTTLPTHPRTHPVARSPRYEIGGASEAGDRGSNEDQLLFVTPKGLETRLDPEPAIDDARMPAGCAFALVADGMGGHGHGDLASGLVTRCLYAGLHAARFDLVAPIEVLEQLIWEAHQQLCDVGRSRAIDAHFGTTATAVWLDGNRASVGHVGDSRLYRLREGELLQLTEDQTYAERMRKSGHLDGVGPHPRLEHVLWSAITGRRPPEVATQQIQVRRGDVFLLCSDGVSNPLDGAQITEALTELPPKAAARMLVDQAHDLGGTDDATAVVIHAK